jgi:hypothetical protein
MKGRRIWEIGGGTAAALTDESENGCGAVTRIFLHLQKSRENQQKNKIEEAALNAGKWAREK